MAKRYLLFILLLLAASHTKAQQYGLFNTRTLFDAFENPAQKAFVLDSSRQYASNFLLPNFGLNAANKGDANYALRRLINGDGIYNTSDIPIGENKRNKLMESTNFYLATFRIFRSYKYHKELGFSWQMRSDVYGNYSNETLVAADNYNRFGSSATGLFNGDAYGQSYHQFSVSYRENYTKRLAFGVKLSLLSGITYNEVDVTESSLTVDPFLEQVRIGIGAQYKSNFSGKDGLNFKTLLPDFKNPGLSVSMGTTYNSKSGFFIMGNIKDLGFIKWNKKSHSFYINDFITLDRLSTNTDDDFKNKIDELFDRSDVQKSFYTPTNAKADFLISRRYDFYTPSFIISKNLFKQGGDVVLVNNFKYNEFSISLSPTYNTYGFGMLGTQGMYQTPNFEFFLGTDNLLKSTAIAKESSLTKTGYVGGSFYMGLGIKFGYTVEHPQNSSYMPGVGDDADNSPSFFGRIFNVFKKK